MMRGTCREEGGLNEGLADVPDKEDAEAMFYWKRVASASTI